MRPMSAPCASAVGVVLCGVKKENKKAYLGTLKQKGARGSISSPTDLQEIIAKHRAHFNGEPV